MVICSGKVYYDLLAERGAKEIKDIAIVRLEQFYPFPERHPRPRPGALPERRCRLVPGGAREHGRLELRRPAHREGAERLDMKVRRPVYIGREAAASPATGLARTHMAQQAHLVATVLGIG